MIDDDDLVLLAASFDGALRAAGTAARAEADLRDLGWVDLLAADPVRGAVATFAVLGHTGSPAALLDDVLAAALGVPRREPGPAALDELVAAHVTRVPFENVSKLYRLRRLGLAGLPPLDVFLDGIERYRLGGTCYSNNCHL